MKHIRIQQQLDSICLYLDRYWEFVNCHMVDYFTSDHFKNFIPADIRTYVKECGPQNIIQNVFWDKNFNATNPVGRFYNACSGFWLENMQDITTTVEEFYQQLKICPNDDQLPIKGFMGEKKLHEVEVASDFIANIMKSFPDFDTYIVDAGDGKGYLSSRLALQHQLKVIGIDANEVNTEGATERTRKLQRVWNGLVEREKLIKAGKSPPRRGKGKTNKNNSDASILGSDNYKVVTQFITPELDLENIINEQFHLENTKELKICLTGLHTCGNLASTCLKVFKAQNIIHCLCNIGCCYHLINEEFCTDDFFVNKRIAGQNPNTGFPMSEYLRKKEIKLGRNARMLASQSIHRTLSNMDAPDKSLFYRALLEQIIATERPDLKNAVQVGKIKKFSSFEQYFRKCDEKLNLQLSQLTEVYLSSMEEKYLERESELNLFLLIRMCMSPIIETLILLDRLLFLYEDGNLGSKFLIKLFDPVVSPRCYAIVALRNTNLT